MNKFMIYIQTTHVLNIYPGNETDRGPSLLPFSGILFACGWGFDFLSDFQSELIILLYTEKNKQMQGTCILIDQLIPPSNFIYVHRFSIIYIRFSPLIWPRKKKVIYPIKESKNQWIEGTKVVSQSTTKIKQLSQTFAIQLGIKAGLFSSKKFDYFKLKN